jgi:hypothetical protein
VASSWLLKAASVLTAALMAGEAIGLCVGMYLLSPRPNPWITARNTLWVVLDLACGIGLACLALRGGPRREAYMLALVLPALGSHLYRAWEYLSRTAANPFLVNEPLWAVNSLKIAGLVIVGTLLMT